MWFQNFILLSFGLISAFNHDPFSGPNIAVNQTTSQSPDCHAISTPCRSHLAVDEQNSTCFQSAIKAINGSSWTVKFKRSYYITGIRTINLKLGNTTYDNSPLWVFGTVGTHNDESPIFQAMLQQGIVYNSFEIKFNSSILVSGVTLYARESTISFCEVQVFSEYCVAISSLSNGGVVIYNNSGENFHRNGDYYQNTAGTIMQLYCSTGYILIGSSLIRCLPSGIYNSSIPKCARALCPVVYPPENGRVTVVENTGITDWNLNKNTVGTILKFSCSEGYFYESGPTFVMCLETGSYNDTTNFLCSEYVCPVVTTLHNGQVLIVGNTGRSDGQKNSVGTVLQFSCNYGFHVSGPLFIRCLDSGSYNDSTNITCLETLCPVVNNLQNGTVTTIGLKGRTDGQNSVGTVLHFSCNQGFRLVGPAVIQCLETGSYNSSVRSMCLELPRCPLFTIYNGEVIFSDLLYKGSTASFTCNKGYKIDRQALLTCDNYTWIGTPPTCARIYCQIPMLHNGKYIIRDSIPFCQQNSTLGSYQCQIYPECDVGYKLLNNQTRQCQDSETWTFVKYEPFCRKICIVPLQIHGEYYYQNDSIVNSTYIENGTEISLKCKEGYRTAGDSNITCHTGSEDWHGNKIMCTNIVCNYTQNETARNGVYINKFGNVFTSGSVDFNETVNLKCELGYEYYSGSPFRTCQTNGTLSGIPAKCRKVACPSLPMIFEVNYQYSNKNANSEFPYNTTVNVSCDKGVLLEGTETRRCTESRKWDGLPPVCIPTCPVPLVPNGALFKELGQIHSNETAFINGTRLLFKCNFCCQCNISEFTCLENHTWSDKPLCYEIRTDTPSVTISLMAAYGGIAGGLAIVIAAAVTVAVLLLKRKRKRKKNDVQIYTDLQTQTPRQQHNDYSQIQEMNESSKVQKTTYQKNEMKVTFKNSDNENHYVNLTIIS